MGLRGSFGESEEGIGKKQLSIEVLPICRVDLTLLQECKIEEVGRSVHLMVELFGVCQLQLILHVGIMPDTLGERKTSNVNKGLLASPSLSL